MKPLALFNDIHSHRADLAERGDTIVSVSPLQPLLPAGTYSVGIHPWETSSNIPLNLLKLLVEKARDPRVVAIGEAGFDRIKGGDLDRQNALFDFHAKLAKKLNKPLIIHAVRADDLLLAAAKKHRPAPGQWIIHGFRGKPAAALALLRAGFSLSFGNFFNQEAFDLTPPDRRYRETDELL